MSDPDDGHWAKASALFDQLVDAPPGDRDALLQRAVATPEVKQHVARMLATLGHTSSFLDQAPQLHPASADPADGYSSLAPGTSVGSFVVDRLIGRGGMGEVYLAHRAQADFTQQVALKLMRPEAIGRQVQFENERRVLAGLDHPGIARLIDGGVAADGRPYMAMEYVEGVDLITYARQHALGLGARLELFRQVCEAVEFAHRNLLVHRDLKPANILVDGSGRARLLDFGIARLLDEGGLSTQSLLTPEYAAPEQFEGAAITLSTDVFALGVVLYELLAGSRPWNLPGLPLAGATMRRFANQPAAPSAAGTRSDLVPARALQGDLDAIVLKALRQEPAQRYQGAALLWRDIERHLQREPVKARGDARGYRFRRFVSRNRLALAATAAVFLALSIGLVGTAWQARAAARERDQVLQEMARVDAVKSYLLLMFRSAGENSADESTTAKQVFDQGARRLAAEYRDQPATYGELVETLGSLYLYMNDYDGAVPILERYLASPGVAGDRRADVSILLAEAELRRGNTAKARSLIDGAYAYWNRNPDRYRKAMVSSRQLQAQIEKEESGLPTSLRTLQAALLEHDAYFGRNNFETANVLNSLGIAYQANGDIDKADAAFRDSWAVHVAIKNVRSAGALLTLGNWATVAYRKNELDRAEKLLTRASTVRRELYGPSAALAAMQANLGKIILRAKRPDDALLQLQPALAMSRQYTGDHSTLTIAIMQSLVEARLQLKQFAPAAGMLAEAKAAARVHSGEDQVLYAICLGLEARLQQANGHQAEARSLADQMGAKLIALGDAGAPYAPEVQKLRAELGLETAAAN
jgi:predicted Ser/Thr protein kinase